MGDIRQGGLGLSSTWTLSVNIWTEIKHPIAAKQQQRYEEVWFLFLTSPNPNITKKPNKANAKRKAFPTWFSNGSAHAIHTSATWNHIMSHHDMMTHNGKDNSNSNSLFFFFFFFPPSHVTNWLFQFSLFVLFCFFKSLCVTFTSLPLIFLSHRVFSVQTSFPFVHQPTLTLCKGISSPLPPMINKLLKMHAFT